MVENFKTGKYPQGSTKLPADYNHGTSHASSTDEGKAAGWVVDLELRADGDELWAQVEWTETAAALIDGKEYQFTSATFSFDYTNSNGGEEIGPTLLAFALTNRPVVHGMQPVALALADPGAVRLATEPGADDAAAEGLFSFDETRRRVQAALSAASAPTATATTTAPAAASTWSTSSTTA
jgi:phage I-like protein